MMYRGFKILGTKVTGYGCIGPGRIKISSPTLRAMRMAIDGLLTPISTLRKMEAERHLRYGVYCETCKRMVVKMKTLRELKAFVATHKHHGYVADLHRGGSIVQEF